MPYADRALAAKPEKGAVCRRLGILCAVMMIIMLCAILAGCEEKKPSSICTQFFSSINTGDYSGAYSLLHASVRYDEERRAEDELAGRSQSSKRISEEQFATKYASIFEALQITGLTFKPVSAVEGDVICVYDYEVYYKSTLVDFEPMSMRMSLRIEDGLWKIEWTPALILADMDWGDTVRVGTLNAERGEIIADGVAYAQSVNAVSICAVPAKICEAQGSEESAEAYAQRKQTAYEQFARQISQLVDGLTPERVLRLLDTDNALVILKQMYPDEYTEEYEALLLGAVNGITVDKSNFGTLRLNPQYSSLAHIIGYTGPAVEEDLIEFTGSPTGDDTYNEYSVVGKGGLERIYERELAGSDGYFIYICMDTGENKKTLYRSPAQNGLDIQLTINPALQELTENLLKYALYGVDTAGAVVVMNPRTGSIDAMASYPSYDLNMFTRGISQTDWERLNNPNESNRPLYNRLTRGLYPPGSTFKPFTAAAALHAGAVTVNTVFPENRELIEEDKWRPSDRGEFGVWHGPVIKRAEFRNRQNPLNMHHGIIYSDNIYFAYIALRMGAPALIDYVTPLGFTESIPFDIPVAQPQLANEGSDWDKPLLAASAFGQGEMLITPLQAASMFSLFANDGTIMEPYIVQGMYREVGPTYEAVSTREPRAWKENLIEADIRNTLAPMLEDVSVTGTAQWLGLKNEMRVASKTGTAELGGNREIAWFTGYRLEGEPRLVVVMLEVPATGEFNMAKFDIARELFREGFMKEGDNDD